MLFEYFITIFSEIENNDMKPLNGMLLLCSLKIGMAGPATSQEKVGR